jgi:hypothetical protein
MLWKWRRRKKIFVVSTKSGEVLSGGKEGFK